LDAANTPAPLTLSEFLRAFGPLERDLDGYPIGQLLNFVSGDPADQATGRRVVDQCLSSWIAALDTALASMPSDPCESLVQIDGRQRCARDALVRLRSTLPPASGEPGRRGPLC
jgi:hypothetical protein